MSAMAMLRQLDAGIHPGGGRLELASWNGHLRLLLKRSRSKLLPSAVRLGSVDRKFRILLIIPIMTLAMLPWSSAQVEGLQDFGNRMEGTAVRKDARGPDFTLISIEGHVDSFVPNSNLHVAFYLPSSDPGQNDSSIFVEASELVDSEHYLMQSSPKLKWQNGDLKDFGPWPTRDVIDRLQIVSSNLAIRAGRRIGTSKFLYSPAFVCAGKCSFAARSYTIHFKSGVDLNKLEVSVYDDTGHLLKSLNETLACNTALVSDCIKFPRDATRTFTLNMSAFPTGRYQVHLIGRQPNTTDTTAMSFSLYNHP